MTQASVYAPSIDQGTYLPGQQEMAAGQTQQTQEQNQIQALMNQYQYTQQLPYNMLSWYSGLLGNNASPFSQGSQASTSGNSSTLTDVGAGVAGAGAVAELWPY